MLEINVSAYDDRFYLDEGEASETFPLTFYRINMEMIFHICIKRQKKNL